MLNETQTILDRLAAADREHQKEAGVRLLLRSVKYACAVRPCRFRPRCHSSPQRRLAAGILLAMIVGGAALALHWYLAFVRRNRLEHIARFLETRDPALGSRLINLLQLGAQTGDPSLAPLTRQLASQAVDNYTAEMRGVPVESLARTDELRRHLKRAAWVCSVSPPCSRSSFAFQRHEIARFADPFGDHPPYSFTHLQIVQPGPAGTNVLYDKGLVVKVKATGHQPREVFLTAFPPGHPDQAVTLPDVRQKRRGLRSVAGQHRTAISWSSRTPGTTSASPGRCASAWS